MKITHRRAIRCRWPATYEKCSYARNSNGARFDQNSQLIGGHQNSPSNASSSQDRQTSSNRSIASCAAGYAVLVESLDRAGVGEADGRVLTTGRDNITAPHACRRGIHRPKVAGRTRSPVKSRVLPAGAVRLAAAQLQGFLRSEIFSGGSSSGSLTRATQFSARNAVRPEHEDVGRTEDHPPNISPENVP